MRLPSRSKDLGYCRRVSPQPPVTGDGVFRDEVVRIAALTVTSPWLENLTFINCQIIGPAVLAFVSDVDLRDSSFEGDLSSIFWEISPDRPTVMGVVGVRNVAFSRCSFRAIGFAGPPEMRNLFARGIGSG